MENKIGAYELAEKIGCTNATIYTWVKKGLPHTVERRGLKAIKRFDYNEVLKWIEENTQR